MRPRDEVHRHPGIAAFAAFVAVSAFFGTFGLASGVLDLGDTINRRLPLRSPVLGGVALAAFVGMPAAATAVLAIRGGRLTELAAVVAGLLLIGWIVVEIAFIRELSLLQLFFALAGIVFIVAGRHALRPPHL